MLRGSDAVGIASETANPIYSLIVKPEIASYGDLRGKLVGLSLPIDMISISMRKLLGAARPRRGRLPRQGAGQHAGAVRLPEETASAMPCR